MRPLPADASEALLAELEHVRGVVLRGQGELLDTWRAQLRVGRFDGGAANLAAYIALRRIDLTRMQARLADLGLSSLGRCEGHVLATLDSVVAALRRMSRGGDAAGGQPPHSSGQSGIAAAASALRQATNRLLGPPPGAHPHFMVTLPTEAAHDARLVAALVEHGMSCARINAAHDDPAIWQAMASQVRRAAAKQRRSIRILVDLPGPKLRTGPMPPGAPVLHLRVRRDERGRLVSPARMLLDGSGRSGAPGKPDAARADDLPRLCVPPEWAAGLRMTDTVVFTDLRERRRTLRIVARPHARQAVVEIDRGAYLAPGTVLTRVRHDGERASTRVGTFAAPPLRIRVKAGERLLLSPAPDAGAPASGRMPAVIGCAEPAAIAHLAPGQTVKIDDGRVTARVLRTGRRGALLKIVQAPPKGANLGMDKGLNFPDARLPAHGLDQRDQTALAFAAAHADIVGYSFVQTGAEIDALHDGLEALTRRRLGVIAKIETAAAVANLPDILVHGAARGPFGVMIARGDLAVEIGWLQLAEVQEELLWLCEAAHVPVVWATQVLDNLVRRGMPTRAELTDAASAERAECVMLNKGPYLTQALDLLGQLAQRMARHQSKKTARYSKLPW